jgi:hypothetical protein
LRTVNDHPASALDLPARVTFTGIVQDHARFFLLVGGALLAAAAVTPFPNVARWFGFALAAYSIVANDSIQTVGTFIASNEHRRWWVLWLFIGGVFVATIAYGWVVAVPSGDVSFGRLASKGFSETPQAFSFLQLAAPVVLLVLTRLRMPVSTTFLILSCFATEAEGLGAVLQKSLWGYVIAFAFGAVLFGATARWFLRYADRPASAWWGPAQWLSTGVLWSSWIMQDMANVAVYLPRQLNLLEVTVFVVVIFFGLGLLFYLRGDRIQRIVSENSSVVDIRAATLIDFVYAFILFGFMKVSTVPMSTTWVFIGLLAGRELALIVLRATGRPLSEGLRLSGRDVLLATIGLVVSVLIAMAANPVVREAILG